MHGMGLCIKLNRFEAHMFYAWSLKPDEVVPISINHNKYFIYFNTYTTVFSWVDGNKN